MGRKRKDHRNRKYGKLLLLDYVRSGGPGSGAIWTAVCDCGNVVEVIARDCASGKRKTCTKCVVGLGLPGVNSIPAPGIPRGHIEFFRRLVRASREMKGPMLVTSQHYNQYRALRCITCGIRDSHAEWADPRGSPTPDNLTTLCRDCGKKRNGENLLDWLKWLVRAGSRVIQGLDKDIE